MNKQEAIEMIKQLVESKLEFCSDCVHEPLCSESRGRHNTFEHFAVSISFCSDFREE